MAGKFGEISKNLFNSKFDKNKTQICNILQNS